MCKRKCKETSKSLYVTAQPKNHQPCHFQSLDAIISTVVIIIAIVVVVVVVVAVVDDDGVSVGDAYLRFFLLTCTHMCGLSVLNR